MHFFRFLHLLLFPVLCSSSSNNQFEKVKSCPKTYEQWTNRVQKKNCGQFQATPDFMCAAIENQPGNFGEICTVVGLSTAGKCAVLDADTYNLNFITCYASSGCPPKAYRASDIYKYEACFGNFYRVQSTTLDTASSTLHVNGNLTIDGPASEQNTVAIVIVTLFVYALILSFLILYLVRKKFPCRYSEKEHPNHLERGLFLDQKTDADKDPSATQKWIRILATYLRYRLLAIADETNLRNKLLLHSESLKENFNGNIEARLMNSSLDDLTKSSLNFVYMLLTNFCGIMTPPRGWGYSPDDSDISPEADIERIRIFVNEYLDNKEFNLEELKTVGKRFHKLYGDINDEIDLDFIHKSKINYVKIKPDCTEDSGTVVTKAIKQILQHLETKGIAICTGAIGCGKTTAMEYISKKYKEGGWQINSCRNLIEKSHIDDVLTGRKTILCCDNLFGRFGCQVFSKEVFKEFDNVIRTLLKQDKNEIRVLLGIHAHVLDEIRSSGCCNTLQDKNKITDLDSLSNSEILLVYQTQQMSNGRNQGATSCKGILKILADRSDSVGTPFQTLMISTMPDVFGHKEFCNKPFEQLCEHFKKLYTEKTEAFLSLIYIMCVTIYNKNKSIDDLAGTISAYLDKYTIDFHLKNLTPFILEDKCTVKLRHELIGIALFHVYFNVMKSHWSLFTACDIKMTLELTRLADKAGQLQNFAVPLSPELCESEASILRKKILESKGHFKDHPLVMYFSQRD